jgi:hypothetical protein
VANNRGVRDSFSRGSLVGKNGKRVWKIGKNLEKKEKNILPFFPWFTSQKSRATLTHNTKFDIN